MNTQTQTQIDKDKELEAQLRAAALDDIYNKIIERTQNSCLAACMTQTISKQNSELERVLDRKENLNSLNRFSSFLWGAFSWHESELGHNFWEQMAYSIEDTESQV